MRIIRFLVDVFLLLVSLLVLFIIGAYTVLAILGMIKIVLGW